MLVPSTFPDPAVPAVSSTILPSSNIFLPSGIAPVALSAKPPVISAAPSSNDLPKPGILVPTKRPPSMAPISAPGGPPIAAPKTAPPFIPAPNVKYFVTPLVAEPINA